MTIKRTTRILPCPEIPLTKGFIAIVDPEDYARTSAFSWHAKPSGNTVYARRNITISPSCQIRELLHRFILGVTDPAIDVDHRDGDGLNNRRSNLRTCNPGQNGFNRRKLAPASSEFKGVSFVKRTNTWIARLGPGGCIYLGKFNTEEDAARAYNAAAIKHFGAFARLNPIEGPPVPKNPCLKMLRKKAG